MRSFFRTKILSLQEAIFYNLGKPTELFGLAGLTAVVLKSDIDITITTDLEGEKPEYTHLSDRKPRCSSRDTVLPTTCPKNTLAKSLTY